MTKKNSKSKFIQAIGKRKSAVALVRIYLLAHETKISINSIIMKKGDFYINNKQLDQVFKLETYRNIILKPLLLTNSEKEYVISVHVRGGGLKGQAGAISHGVSKALTLIDITNNKPILKKNKLLTRDSRIRERRKVGMGGKSRRKRQSPKR